MFSFLRKRGKATREASVPPTPYEEAIKAAKQHQLIEEKLLEAPRFQCQAQAKLLEGELRKLAEVSGNKFKVFAFQDDREDPPIYFKTTLSQWVDDELGSWPMFLYAGVISSRATPYFKFTVGYGSHHYGFDNPPTMSARGGIWLHDDKTFTDMGDALRYVIDKGSLLEAIKANGNPLVIDGTTIEILSPKEPRPSSWKNRHLLQRARS